VVLLSRTRSGLAMRRVRRAEARLPWPDVLTSARGDRRRLARGGGSSADFAGFLTWLTAVPASTGRRAAD
jgi:hypothetical protein